MKYFFLIIGLFIGFIIGINFNNKGESDQQVVKESMQKYVYIDNTGRIHKDKLCINLMENEYSVRFIKSCNVTDSMLQHVCPMCFTDELYDLFHALNDTINWNQYKVK